MTNRAGTLVSNLSGEMAYESFRPTLLPPNPPIEVSGELFTKLMPTINSHLTATSAVPVAAEGITTVAAMAPAAGLCCLSLLLL